MTVETMDYKAVGLTQDLYFSGDYLEGRPPHNRILLLASTTFIFLTIFSLLFAFLNVLREYVISINSRRHTSADGRPESCTVKKFIRNGLRKRRKERVGKGYCGAIVLKIFRT